MMADLGGRVLMSTCGVYEGLGLDEFIPRATYKVRDFSFDPRMGEAERLRQEARSMGDEARAQRKRAQARILDFDPNRTASTTTDCPSSTSQRSTWTRSVSPFTFTIWFLISDRSPRWKIVLVAWLVASLVAVYSNQICTAASRGPMKFTNAVYKSKDDYELCEAVNIFSVNIASSDVGFPIHVYGTVIARDSLDKKCVCLFRRDRDSSQLINSEEDPLILTGPKRGLALIGDAYVETDLKIKGELEDKQLSKGILTIRGIARRTLRGCELETGSLATRLSTVSVTYGVVRAAVEGTILIQVMQGDFNGKITACATSIQKSLILYDSEVPGTVAADDNGLLQLLQPVISVYMKEMMQVTILAADGETKTVKFAPKVCGGEKIEIKVGDTRMLLQVTWSIIDY